MIIRAVRATNFMRFGDFALENLPEAGLIGIFGENESGKSTLGDLISFNLFGRSTRAPDGNPDRVIHWGEDTCSSEMEFSVSGLIYLITRRVSRDGTTDGSLVCVSENGRILASTAAEIPGAVEELLGFGFKEFRYSTFIAQNELDIILRSAEDRRMVLNNMLGVGFMEKMARKVAAKRSDREKELGVVRRRLEDKREVYQVYEARRQDMERVVARQDRENMRLLKCLRDREQNQSTISLLEEVRRKGEMFEILDQRVSKRREELKLVEAESSSLLRQVEQIPRLKEENRDKRIEIENIRGSRTEELRGKVEKIKTYKELTAKIESINSQVLIKETELNELNEKIEELEKVEIRIKEVRSENEVLSAFIETYGGPEKFRTTASYLQKDLKLLESEIEKVTIGHDKDIEMIAERREAFGVQKERVKRQIEAATVQEVDREKLERIQASERANSLGKDICMALAVVALLGGLIPAMITINMDFLLICLGVAPTMLGGILFHSKVRQINQVHQQLQQQLYAFNISQRGVLELQESMDEIDRRLIDVESDIVKVEKVRRKLGGFRLDCFEGLESSIQYLNPAEEEELSRAIHLVKDILNTYSEFRSLISDDKQPFRGLTTYNPDRVVAVKMEKRIRLDEEMAGLKREAEARPALVRQSQEILTALSALRTESSEIDAKRISLGVTDDDEEPLRQEEENLKIEAARLERETEENLKEIERLEKLGAQAAALEERRKKIIDEIDEDLIKHYELKEATYDIDYSDSKFNEMKNRDIELGEKAEECRENIRDIEIERKTVQKDLDRIPEVLDEMNGLRKDLENREALIMKLLELENLYKKTGLNIRRRLVPQIEAYFGWILPKMTRGRYHRVRLDDSFEIKVLSDEYGDYVNLDVLSGGTVDQLLISLRLAFARATCTGTGASSPFLFLDEPFSSFDEARREQFFNLLRILKTNFQQIFLISHLPNLEDFVDYYMRLDLEKGRLPSYKSWSK